MTRLYLVSVSIVAIGSPQKTEYKASGCLLPSGAGSARRARAGPRCFHRWNWLRLPLPSTSRSRPGARFLQVVRRERLGAGRPGPWPRAHNQALRPAVNRLAVIPAVILLKLAA